MSLLKLGISGATGRIGRHLIRLASAQTNINLQSGLVSHRSKSLGEDLGEIAGIGPLGLLATNQFNETCDVLIDFSTANAFNSVIDACVMSQTALVTGTTGLNQEHYDRISQAAKFIPVIWTSNFSINIQLIKNLLNVFHQKNKQKSVNITETHHLHKLDMPSGTAISLAQEISPVNSMVKVSDNEFNIGDVQIKSLREGEVSGIHEVEIKLKDESIQLRHEAHNPGIFADGAIKVAQWIKDKPQGLYSLNDYLLS